MAQLSFFSAEANPPAVGDLAGLLCGPGQLASFGGVAARLSVPVADPWRARALAVALADRGIDAGLATADDGMLVVRTAFRVDLIRLATAWSGAAAKAVPAGLALAGAALRLWVVAAGGWSGGGYLLGLDPGAPGTHEQLRVAVAGCGLPSILHQDREEGPGLRISGRRRLARLAELVGCAPSAAAEAHWPSAPRVRQSA